MIGRPARRLHESLGLRLRASHSGGSIIALKQAIDWAVALRWVEPQVAGNGHRSTLTVCQESPGSLPTIKMERGLPQDRLVLAYLDNRG